MKLRRSTPLSSQRITMVHRTQANPAFRVIHYPPPPAYTPPAYTPRVDVDCAYTPTYDRVMSFYATRSNQTTIASSSSSSSSSSGYNTARCNAGANSDGSSIASSADESSSNASHDDVDMVPSANISSSIVPDSSSLLPHTRSSPPPPPPPPSSSIPASASPTTSPSKHPKPIAATTVPKPAMTSANFTSHTCRHSHAYSTTHRRRFQRRLHHG